METTDNLNIFEELKAHREAKKITLQEISAESRIQIMYLEAIEAGAFEKIPEVYDKLFFQSYLSYLQVEDEQKYLDAFRALRKQTFSPTPTTTMRRLIPKQDDGHPVFNKKNMIIVLPLLFIIALIVFFAINSQLVETPEKEKVAELPIRQIAREIEARQKTPSAAEAVSEVTEGPKEILVRLELSAVDSTWMRFIKDHRDTVEYLLSRGHTVTIEADSVITGIVGNAGGLRWRVNGKDEGILGKKGDVLTSITVSSAGIVKKKIKSRQTTEAR
ncbi:MAG: helix-turn-helix domain-containing protein [Calditrichaeota bacterium]|nr:MAG: helix-turn-helix domain-containing protein [Calditrichota bacterium]